MSATGLHTNARGRPSKTAQTWPFVSWQKPAWPLEKASLNQWRRLLINRKAVRMLPIRALTSNGMNGVFGSEVEMYSPPLSRSTPVLLN